jgi:hypothetical protein
MYVGLEYQAEGAALLQRAKDYDFWMCNICLQNLLLGIYRYCLLRLNVLSLYQNCSLQRKYVNQEGNQ